MSNIYIQEPPSNGKVLLKTTVGDIDVELWSKEAPKAARNFVQLCLEGYYDGTAFHRVVKDFIVQGGDPTDSGDGGESIYGAPFKDEFHQRLRFVRRGLVAMANAGPHDNGSQFFFTMAATPELQNKHTIFGKVVGDTLFNMLKLQEVEVNEVTEKPTEPHRIVSTEVLNNPFDDIVPRQIKRVKKDKEDEKKIKSKSKATKNFSLLSFGDEAEDDEEQVDKATESFRGKSKSSHDLTDDPRLSSIPAVEKDLTMEEDKRKKKAEGSPDKKPDTDDKEIKAKTDVAEEEGKKKAEPADDTKKGKTETKEEEKKKKQPDTPETPEKKKSPIRTEEGDGQKKKAEGEEEVRKTIKEEPKEDSRKKKPEAEAAPAQESRKRKAEDGHKEERKKRSKEREDEDRKKRKTDSKEEEGRKKRKGEEEKKKAEEEKGDGKKKIKTEPAEASTQPAPEEKVVKEEGTPRKAKKEKEETPSRAKEQEGRSLLGSSEDGKQQRMEELKKEQRKLQRDIKDFKKRAHDKDKVKVKMEEPEETEEKEEEDTEETDLLAMVKKERQKYKLRKRELGGRENREDATLAMLARFQTKLNNARTLGGDYDDDDVDEEEEKNAEDEEDDDPEDMSWMRHKLHFADATAKTKVIDANVHDDDRYTLHDPRNPLTQRRRETSKKAMRDKR